MGKRGRPTTPTKLKLLRGNPGNRPLNIHEPKPRKVMPVCPSWLSKDEKAVWKRIAPKLSNMGVLTEIDGQALVRYCVLWIRWKQQELFIKEHGSAYPIKNEDGSLKYLQQYPAVAIANKLSSELNRLEDRFGMTPSARTSIQVQPSSGNDQGLEYFLGKRKKA